MCLGAAAWTREVTQARDAGSADGDERNEWVWRWKTAWLWFGCGRWRRGEDAVVRGSAWQERLCRNRFPVTPVPPRHSLW